VRQRAEAAAAADEQVQLSSGTQQSAMRMMVCVRRTSAVNRMRLRAARKQKKKRKKKNKKSKRKKLQKDCVESGFDPSSTS
jgi:hypothetical protein